MPDTKLELWDVNHVIRESAELYLDRGEELSIKTSLEQVPATMIDDEQLKRVFVNLFDNAIEAPGPKPTSVRVASRFDPARDLIVVEVSDNGKGIDPSDQPKLFQPYFSTKGRGTGLGLAIVQRILTDHKGKIKAVPNQPHGARFIIELPVSTGN